MKHQGLGAMTRPGYYTTVWPPLSTYVDKLCGHLVESGRSSMDWFMREVDTASDQKSISLSSIE